MALELGLSSLSVHGKPHYRSDDYPDRTEYTQPDYDIHKNAAKAGESAPGSSGNGSRVPGAYHINIALPNSGISIAFIIRSFKSNCIKSGFFIGVSRGLIYAGVPIAKVPSIIIGSEPAGYLRGENNFFLRRLPLLCWR